MNPFRYENGVLHADGVSLAELATKIGTPFYCYSESAISAQYRAYADAFADQDTVICYAMKANDNLAILRTFAELCAGADVVSGGELQRALAAGIPPSKIIFSGVGKTEDELALALSTRIMQINVESSAFMPKISRARKPIAACWSNKTSSPLLTAMPFCPVSTASFKTSKAAALISRPRSKIFI